MRGRPGHHPESDSQQHRQRRADLLENPANPKEDICEKWQNVPESFDAFVEAVRRFRDRWERLLERPGIDAITAELADLFEDEPTKPVKSAVEEFTRRRVGDPRSQNAAGDGPIDGHAWHRGFSRQPFRPSQQVLRR